MNKLLNKYKRIKSTKKGFTLVELLVVIAILAVLASVSVVGYLGFTTKARNSNAMTELAQVREVLRAELIDGDTYTYTKKDSNDEVYSISYKYDGTDYTFTFTYNTTKLTDTLSFNDVIRASFSDVADLKGTLYVTTASDFSCSDVEGQTSIKSGTGKFKTVGYATTAGGYALWTISGDKLDTSDKTTVVIANNNLYTKAA